MRTPRTQPRRPSGNLLDLLGSPVFVNATTGNLSEEAIAEFRNESDRAIEQMEIAGEISGGQTLIDPTQDVLTTSLVRLSVEQVPTGTARDILVDLTNVLKLS